MTSKKTSSPPKQFNFSRISLHFMNLPLCLLPMMFLAYLVPLPPRVSLARCDLPVSNEANEVSELRSRLESPPKSSKADSELWKSLSLSRYARLRHLRQLGDWGPSKTSQVFPNLVFPGLVFGISQFPDLVFRRQIAQKAKQDTRFSISLMSCAWTA